MKLLYFAYQDEDSLKDGASQEPSPIRIAEKCTDEGEEIHRAGPLADAVGRLRIFLTHHTC